MRTLWGCLSLAVARAHAVKVKPYSYDLSANVKWKCYKHAEGIVRLVENTIQTNHSHPEERGAINNIFRSSQNFVALTQNVKRIIE